MTDENKKNIENNQEENRNKPEDNRNWWRKLLALNPTYGFIIFLTFIFQASFVCATTNYDYINGTFEKIKIDIKSIVSKPIKIGNEVLFIGENYVYILQENGNIKKIEQKIKNAKNYSSIKLNDNNILFVGASNLLPSEKFRDEIYNIIFRNKPNSYSKVKRYNLLTEREKEEFYLPFFKNDAKFLEEYKNYVKEYENSMYAILYNVKTNEYKKVGKINVRRSNPKLLLLENGNVLIWNGYAIAGKQHETETFELYDSSTKKFIILKDLNCKNCSVFELKNNEIFSSKGEIYNIKTKNLKKLTETYWYNPIVINGEMILNVSGELYDHKTGKIHRVKNFHLNNHQKVLKLQNNKILFNSKLSDINIYNIKNDIVEAQCSFLAKRTDNTFNMLLLNNGQVLFFGGHYNAHKNNSISQILYSEGYYQNKLELFDPELNQTKLIKQSYSSFLLNPILLDNGKILFTSENEYILFIPKK